MSCITSKSKGLKTYPSLIFISFVQSLFPQLISSWKIPLSVCLDNILLVLCRVYELSWINATMIWVFCISLSLPLPSLFFSFHQILFGDSVWFYYLLAFPLSAWSLQLVLFFLRVCIWSTRGLLQSSLQRQKLPVRCRDSQALLRCVFLSTFARLFRRDMLPPQVLLS